MTEKDKSKDVSEAEVAEVKEPKIVSYQLVRDFWDNRRVQPKGTVVDFPEGKAPRGSVKLTKAEAKTLRGHVVEAALDPVNTKMELMFARLEKLEAENAELKKTKAAGKVAAK